MFRKGTLDDAAAMARIFNYYVANSDVIFSERILTEDDMRRKLSSLGVAERFPFIIAEMPDGRMGGYGYAHLYHPDPVYGQTWELTIYLDHECLGQGIGSEMLRRLVAACRTAGAHALISCITGGNTACERMHIRQGFFEAGRLRAVGFKFGSYLDDVIYEIVF